MYKKGIHTQKKQLSGCWHYCFQCGGRCPKEHKSFPIIEEIKRTKRPVVLTQHGKSAAVILDVAEYERILEKIELLSDIELAESQIENGQGISHDQAKSQILKRLNK